MLKPALEASLRAYGEAHRAPRNRVANDVAMPLIVFSALAMLSWISLGAPFGLQLHLAHLVWLALVGWYLSLDVGLGLLIGLMTATCLPVVAVTPRALVVLIALAGWGTALLGNRVWEKQRPTPRSALLEALIGPLFIVAKLVGLWPARRAAVSPH